MIPEFNDYVLPIINFPPNGNLCKDGFIQRLLRNMSLLPQKPRVQLFY